MRKISKNRTTRTDSSASSSSDSSDNKSETNAKVPNEAGKKDGANDLEDVKSKSQDCQDTKSKSKKNLHEQNDGNNKRKRPSNEESDSSSESDASDDEALSKKLPVDTSSKGKGKKKDISGPGPIEVESFPGGDDVEYEVEYEVRFELALCVFGQCPKRLRILYGLWEAVEEIVSHKKSHGQMLYLIRWKGFGSEDDTWENAVTLDNCPEILKKYTDLHPDSMPPPPKGKVSKGSKNKKSEKLKKLKAIIAEPVDANADYEVERIIDVFFKKDQSREFLVRWKGYGKEYDTWEPENNLNCPDLIEKFIARLEYAKNLSEKELRPNRKHTERFTLRTQTSERRLSKRHDGKQRAVYYDAED